MTLAVAATGELLQIAPSPSGHDDGREDVLRALLGMVSWKMGMLPDALYLHSTLSWKLATA